MATASDIANNKQAFDLLNQPQVEAISSLVEGLQLANLAAIEEFGSWCSGSLTDTSTSLPLPEGHDLDTKKLLSQAVRAVVVLYSDEPIIRASAWSPATLKDKAAKIIVDASHEAEDAIVLKPAQGEPVTSSIPVPSPAPVGPASPSLPDSAHLPREPQLAAGRAAAHAPGGPLLGRGERVRIALTP